MAVSAGSFGHELRTIVRPYWRSEERGKSGALLAAVIALDLGTVYLNVLFNDWYRLFYNALQEHDFAGFLHQFARFGVLAAAFIGVGVYRVYLRQMLQIRWRRWLTERYINEWMSDRAYYRLQLTGKRTDNPDQRIAEDIGAFVNQTLVLGLGLLQAVVTLISFAAILWELSGSFAFLGVVIPGYMLWAAIIYAISGSWLAHRIGRPLIGLNFQQQQFEADLRFSLVRVRENAEGVALYGGEREEAKGLAARMANVVSNWWAIMRRQKQLTWFSAGYEQLAVIFPFLVAAPRYFSGAIELGGLMQIGQAFGQVQTALSWFITAYADLAAWKATVDRLSGFERALSDAAEVGPTQAVRRERPAGDDLEIRDFEVWLPDGARLLQEVNLRLQPGSRILLSGPSGSGKSTLLRAISGIWPYCRGVLAMPEGGRLLFLPQKAYIPIATLREAATYPDAPDELGDTAIRKALTDCGLGSLASKLDERRYWAQQLSPGEQQRLAFVRVLLLKPRWLFLDEATSALDEPSEAHLYRMITERAPETALVSVAHRSSLARFHNQRLTLASPSGADARSLIWSDELGAA